MNQGKMPPIDEDREFQRYYDRHLKPLEQRFESLRLKAMKETQKRIIAALTAWLAAVVVIGSLSPKDSFMFAMFIAIFLVAGIGLGIWAWLPGQGHVDRLKEEILPRIVSFFGDLRYQSEPDFDPGRYDEWKVLPNYDETYLEDQIEGCYHGVPLKLAEVRLTYRESRTSGGNTITKYITMFDGLMIIFELEREYPGITLIRSRGSNMIEHLDETLDEVSAGSGFEVFATHDAPGGKLADARFLERLAEVATQFEARHLFASFHANRLVMMIWHKGNYFEMSLRQKTNFAKDAERVREQLGRIFAIVDRLHLEGVSVEDRKDIRSSQRPIFPELSGIDDTAQSDRGNWGCLMVFVMFAATMSAYLRLLEADWILWWSAFGGVLMSLGLFQTIRGVLRRSVSALIFGITLLAGAFLVLYFSVSLEIQELIRAWVQGL